MRPAGSDHFDEAADLCGRARTVSQFPFEVTLPSAGSESKLTEPPGWAIGHCWRMAFTYYTICMSKRETINGVPVTEEQISEWVAEAEAGYDIEVLKKRGRGRPGRGAEPSQVVALRLTSDELAALDARAAREHKTRSELIRDALAAYAA
jgi:hypothetical protein